MSTRPVGSLTQRERVLRLLRQRGSRGVCAPDFLLPDIADGGRPITRLAARVAELRAAGHIIVPAGSRGGCRVSRHVSDPLLPSSTPTTSAHLFAPPAAVPASPYDVEGPL
jgi:hypothetical protein